MPKQRGSLIPPKAGLRGRSRSKISETRRRISLTCYLDATTVNEGPYLEKWPVIPLRDEKCGWVSSGILVLLPCDDMSLLGTRNNVGIKSAKGPRLVQHE